MAGSTSQMAQTPRPDRSRPPPRSIHDSRPNPPRANAKYSSKRFPPDLATENSSVGPPSSPTSRPFAPRSSQRKASSASVRFARPPTPVSKGSMDGSHSSAQHGPQSTLLQEKLQQERRSEIQRGLTRLADERGPDSDANKPTPATTTPTRSGASDAKQQDAAPGSAGSKKGLALKETEQVSSQTHHTIPVC